MKSYIVGNWKMNFTVGESSVYLHKLMQRIRASRDCQVIAAPSFTALQPLSLQIDRKKIRLAAQTADPHDFGPYTGEVSVSQLRGLVDYCIIGQAERRQLLHESDKRIRATVAAALRYNIRPILCLGETSTERSFGESGDVLRDQLLGGLAEVSAEDLSKIILVYEPVWAISSTIDSHIASPDEVASSFAFIREVLTATYGPEIASSIPILYGGSVNSINAGAYLTIPGVNGLLVGGSSIIADEFIKIVDLAKRVKE